MPKFNRKCKVEGCTRGVSAKDLCNNHWAQDERRFFNRLKEVALGKDPLEPDLKRAYSYIQRKTLTK